MSDEQKDRQEIEPSAPEAPKKEARAKRWKKKLEKLLEEDANIYPLF